MKRYGVHLEDAYKSWLSSSVDCCVVSKPEPPTQLEKHMKIEHQQPRLIPPPIFAPQSISTIRSRDPVPRRSVYASVASGRGNFSVRRKITTHNGHHGRPTTLKIGAPSDFRHLNSSSTVAMSDFRHLNSSLTVAASDIHHPDSSSTVTASDIQQPDSSPSLAIARRTEIFRPLELSIYLPGDGRLSPMLPFFEDDRLSFLTDGKNISHPQKISAHSRNRSGQSFRIPRKPISASSDANSEWVAQYQTRPDSMSTHELQAAIERELPKAPEPARLRATIDPPAYARVKSALHEKFELEQRLRDIEEIIVERQSIYFNSRPTSRVLDDRPTSIYSEFHEPMPPIPNPFFTKNTLPRFHMPSEDQRAETMTANTVHSLADHKLFTEASAVADRAQNNRARYTSHPPPPLPLVLTPSPPHQRKKSAGRVSNWLFSPDHSRTTSLSSVTNRPKVIKAREGFYQCVELSSDEIEFDMDKTLERAGRSRNTDSISTVTSLESELDATTLSTTNWSPHSSPDRFDKGPAVRSLSLSSVDEVHEHEQSVRAFAKRDANEDAWRKVHVPSRNSVGVAF